MRNWVKNLQQNLQKILKAHIEEEEDKENLYIHQNMVSQQIQMYLHHKQPK